MKARKKLIRWIKEHKRELLLAGVCVTGVSGAILLVRNRKVLMEYWALLRRAVNRPSVASSVAKAAEESVHVTEAAKAIKKTERIPFEVTRHVRNLPDGRHASPGKIATAIQHGIDLHDGQTWVVAYMKGAAA